MGTNNLLTEIFKYTRKKNEENEEKLRSEDEVEVRGKCHVIVIAKGAVIFFIFNGILLVTEEGKETIPPLREN